MASLSFKLKRSNIAHKRPDPDYIGYGELNINYNDVSGSLFFKDSAGNVRKVGPTEVGPTPPNSDPAGSAGNSSGELWYDTTSSTLKLWDSANWVPVVQEPAPASRSCARMWWNDNSNITIINAGDTYYLMDSSGWSLDTHSSGFSLAGTYPGLTYTGSNTITVIVTCTGEFDGYNTSDYRFAIAKTSATPSLPDDVASDSITFQREDRVSKHFSSESLLSLDPGDLIYPVVKNVSNSDDVEISSLSFLIKEA